MKLLVIQLIILGFFLSFIGCVYEIIFDRVVPFHAISADDDLADLKSFRVKKFNRSTYVVNGNFTMKKPFLDEYFTVVYASNSNGAHFQRVAHRKFTNGCTLANDDKFKDYYEDIRKVSNIPERKTCPLPAGRYYVKDFSFKPIDMLPPYIPGGEKWKLEVRFYETEDESVEPLSGYDLYVTLRKVD